MVLTKRGKNGSSYQAIRLKNEILEKLKSFSPPYTAHSPHIIIESLVRFNKELEKGKYFFSDIKKEGICLYDSEEFTLSDAKELTNQEVKQIAQEDFEYWFENGDEFLKNTFFNIKEEMLKKAAFMLHQATESFLNCALLVLTGYKPKSHDIADLLKKCASWSKEFLNIFPQAPSNLKQKTNDHRLLPVQQIELLYDSESKADWFELLKKAYIDSRYSKDYKITKEQLEYLIEKVLKLKEVTKEVCEQRIKGL